jgi:hypothetical protein
MKCDIVGTEKADLIDDHGPAVFFFAPVFAVGGLEVAAIPRAGDDIDESATGEFESTVLLAGASPPVVNV